MGSSDDGEIDGDGSKHLNELLVLQIKHAKLRTQPESEADTEWEMMISDVCVRIRAQLYTRTLCNAL